MYLFTNFEGRISRRTFWFGLLVIILVGLGISLFAVSFIGTPAFVGTTGLLGRLAMFVLSLPVLFPIIALVVKRLHDRDHAAYPRAFLFAGATLIISFINATKIGFTTMTVGGRTFETPGAASYLTIAACMVVMAWLMIGLGLRQGTRGSNRFGPDPRAAAP